MKLRNIESPLERMKKSALKIQINLKEEKPTWLQRIWKKIRKE